MLVLLAAVALAAPLAPTGLPGPGVEVAAYATTGHTWLHQAQCTGDACDAWRNDVLYGGEVGVNIARPISLYLHAAHVSEEVVAERYAGQGYALGGGVRLALPIGPRLGVSGWAGLEQQLTGVNDLTEELVSWDVDAGAVLRGGAPDDGFQGWIGAGVVPWSTETDTVLGGDLALDMRPRVPVDAVIGGMWVSDPLLGPWDDRTRLGAGITASVGLHTTVTGFLSFLY